MLKWLRVEKGAVVTIDTFTRGSSRDNKMNDRIRFCRDNKKHDRIFYCRDGGSPRKSRSA
jgi:hypothetical protein